MATGEKKDKVITGADAITPTASSSDNLAIRRLVRGPDGRMKVVFIDLFTLLPVLDTTDYTIVDGNYDLVPEEVEDADDPALQQGMPVDDQEESRSDRDSMFDMQGLNQFPSAPPQYTASPLTAAPVGRVQQEPLANITPELDGLGIARNPYDTMQGQVRPNVDRLGIERNPYDTQYSPTTGLATYSENYGPLRPDRPSDAIIGAVQQSVTNVVGPGAKVVGISGVGEYGSARHRDHMGGVALDFDVYDQYGNKITDDATMHAIGVDFAATNPTGGIGYGDNYMAPGRMHLDLSDLGGYWGSTLGQESMDPTLRTAIDVAREQPGPSNRPTPTARPSTPMETSIRSVESNYKADPLGYSAPSLNTSAVNVNNSTPAQFAHMGIIQRTPEEREQIGFTLAGELSRETLEGIKVGDPEAMRELANMVTTVENRANSRKWSSLDEALSPTQYNSLMDTSLNGMVPLNNTQSLFDEFGQDVMNAVNAFYNGDETMTPDDYSLTNYHANYVTPSWSEMMSNVSVVGNHIFGALPEYSANENFRAMRETYGRLQGVGVSRNPFDTQRTNAFQSENAGTFGTSQSPGVGRSSLGTRDAFSSRDGSGTFGTGASPGVGRSSLGSIGSPASSGERASSSWGGSANSMGSSSYGDRGSAVGSGGERASSSWGGSSNSIGAGGYGSSPSSERSSPSGGGISSGSVSSGGTRSSGTTPGGSSYSGREL